MQNSNRVQKRTLILPFIFVEGELLCDFQVEFDGSLQTLFAHVCLFAVAAWIEKLCHISEIVVLTPYSYSSTVLCTLFTR